MDEYKRFPLLPKHIRQATVLFAGYQNILFSVDRPGYLSVITWPAFGSKSAQINTAVIGWIIFRFRQVSAPVSLYVSFPYLCILSRFIAFGKNTVSEKRALPPTVPKRHEASTFARPQPEIDRHRPNSQPSSPTEGKPIAAKAIVAYVCLLSSFIFNSSIIANYRLPLFLLSSL